MRKPSNVNGDPTFFFDPADTFVKELVSVRPLLKKRAMALLQNEAAADDLVQDTLERALSSRYQFKNGNIQAWASSILRHLFIDGWRHTALHLTVGVDNISSQCERDEPHEIGPVDLLLAADIRASMANLPERYRQIVELAYVHHASYCEIASRLGIGVNTVGTRLFRARARIRTALAKTFASRLLSLQGPSREGGKKSTQPYRAQGSQALETQSTRTP